MLVISLTTARRHSKNGRTGRHCCSLTRGESLSKSSHRSSDLMGIENLACYSTGQWWYSSFVEKSR